MLNPYLNAFLILCMKQFLMKAVIWRIYAREVTRECFKSTIHRNEWKTYPCVNGYLPLKTPYATIPKERCFVPASHEAIVYAFSLCLRASISPNWTGLDGAFAKTCRLNLKSPPNEGLWTLIRIPSLWPVMTAIRVTAWPALSLQMTWKGRFCWCGLCYEKLFAREHF